MLLSPQCLSEDVKRQIDREKGLQSLYDGLSRKKEELRTRLVAQKITQGQDDAN